MKKNIINCISIFCLLFLSNMLFAQAAINTTGAIPDASAMLDITSNAKGVLIPRMLENDRTSISSPAEGLLVYQTDEDTGFYYFDGANWILISAGQQNALINSANASILGLTYVGQSKTAANNKPAFRFVSDKGYYIDIDHNDQLGTSWIWYTNADCTGTPYASSLFYGPGATFASPGDGSLFYINLAATTTTAPTVQSRYIVDSNTCQVMNPGSGEYYPLTANNSATTGITLSSATAYKVTFYKITSK